jgi:DNA-binding SARP family transcriptional activator
MELQLLGPVEMTGPAGAVQLRANKERLLLALLALRANRVVSMSELIAGLWGQDPPATAAKTAHGHVARLRRALDAAGLPDVLRTREPGYVLNLDPTCIDAVQFEQRLREARGFVAAGDLETSCRALEAALDLWHGDAIADCRDRSETVAAEAVRLDELRVVAVEELIQVRLQLGANAELVGDLEALLLRYPLRERIWGALIVALYRA